MSIESLFAFIILALPIFPLVRLCISAAFVRAFPYLAAAIVLGLAAYFSLVISFLVSDPNWSLYAAAAALIAVGLERWRARGNYGTARGLPPGSLAIFPIDVLLDPLALSKRAQRYGPIFKLSGSIRRAGMSGWLKPMICIVGLERARELLTRYEDALESPEPPYSGRIPRKFLRYMDPTDHRIYRPLFQTMFSPEIARANELFIAEQIRKTFAIMSAKCADSRAGISPSPYLSKMVLHIWLRLFFGIEPDSPRAARLELLYRRIDTQIHRGFAFEDARETLAGITTLIRAESESWSSDGKLSAAPRCYLAELLTLDPNAFAESTLTLNLIYMLENTCIDTASLLLWILKKLGDNSAWFDRVRSETEPSSTLAERIVMETLRLAQSEYLIRRTREEINFAGWRMPKGWLIRVCVHESHLDPAVFQDPLSFNPDRFLGRDYSRIEYSPFGFARHACLGSHLVLSIGGLFVRELAQGYDSVVSADGPLEFTDFHWQPNSRFRVRLMARSGTGSSTRARSSGAAATSG